MMKKITLATLAAMIVSSTAFAETVKVDFPVGQKNGTFNCTASDKLATVNIDTDSVEARGFCAGSQYVTREGHIQNLPTSELKNYFEIEKDPQKRGNVTITVSKGTISCSSGRGDKTTSYGSGKFCARKK